MKVFRDKEFDCELLFQSETYKEVKKITDEISGHEIKIKDLTSEVEKLYSDCEHEYYFSSRGMYDDGFRCIKCGHYRWF